MRLTILFASVLAAYGQSPTFEVASIKPYVQPEGQTWMRVGCRGGPETPDPTRWSCENMSVANLIRLGYDLKSNQLAGIEPYGGPSFNIEAKIAPGTTKEQFRQMVQNLLAERFSLKVHREQKEMPGYELVVAKGGPKFKESPPEKPADPNAEPASPPAGAPGRLTLNKDGYPDLAPGRSGMAVVNGMAAHRGVRTTMEQLANMIAGQVGRPVVDATGLTGKYDTHMQWTASRPSAPPPAADGSIPPASDPGGPTVTSALQDQLGLRLESKKVTIEVLVVDSVAKTPTEN